MIIDNINLNHLRIFECVYRTGSATTAAKELFLTQSGVSQHIKSLEGSIDIKLFDRVNKKMVPTPPATSLYNECKKGLYSIESTLLDIKGENLELTGTVYVGIPNEFGNNCVLISIAQFCKKHQKVKFDITYGLAADMNDLLVNGKLDFAFVDEYALDKRIQTKPVYEETLSLYASKNYMKNWKSYKYEDLDYISYLDSEPVLRLWFRHHLNLKNIDLKVRATAMEVQGVSQLILSDVGVGILPEHHARRLKNKKDLYKFKGSGKPLKNKISIAYLAGRSQSASAKAAMNEIISSL